MLPNFITGLAFVTISFLAIKLRQANPLDTFVENAKDALSHIQEWAKWMAGLQTAAIAGLWLLLTEKDSSHFIKLDDCQKVLALSGFIFLGAAILCSGWVLSSVPTQIIRLPRYNTIKPSKIYDIYEQPLYGYLNSIKQFKSIKLGDLLSLNHWYWATGLICLATLVSYKFIN